MMYMIYLILFSYTALTTKKETMPTVIEWLVIITAFSYFVAELYQVRARSYFAKIHYSLSGAEGLKFPPR